MKQEEGGCVHMPSWIRCWSHKFSGSWIIKNSVLEWQEWKEQEEINHRTRRRSAPELEIIHFLQHLEEGERNDAGGSAIAAPTESKESISVGLNSTTLATRTKVASGLELRRLGFRAVGLRISLPQQPAMDQKMKARYCLGFGSELGGPVRLPNGKFA
mmetsp:Transcript_2912/g.5796  ORF Transcript_2912/g.5796 Transcript_2912/m.5796 type:complete len:158 (+) Transcript_2912:2-475(+)